MLPAYKIDVFEKFVEFLSLFYFVFGFFTTYAWACKELDKISNISDINTFWEPVAAVYSVMNVANIAGIAFCIFVNRKSGTSEEPINKENNLLFHILCTPLFFVTILYLCWDFVNGCMTVEGNGTMSIFMTVCEMLLFIGAMSLILTVNKSRFNPSNVLHCKLNCLVLLMTLIGVLNYFLFHMTGQQIDNFVKTASNFSSYKEYYNSANINRTKNLIYFNEVKDYVQPLVILFSCCCVAYLVTLLYRANMNVPENQELQNDIIEHDGAELNSRHNSEENLLLPVETSLNTPPFRLPPLSLLLGILFITITILILVIVVSLTAEGTDRLLQKSGELAFIIFPMPVYVISIALMFVQINEMERWPKLKKNKNTVDKALVWIGAAGQLIVSLAQLKLITSQISFENVNDSINLFGWIIVLYLLLIIQTLLQSLTICLALDRQWLPPAIETWQEYICPPVGLLSINIGFFLFSVYSVKNDGALVNFTMMANKTQLFLKIFGTGFNSLGETLAILSRLHSSLIFGKMIAYTNNKK